MLYFVTLNSSSQSKQLAKFEVFIRVSSTQRPGYHKDPIFQQRISPKWWTKKPQQITEQKRKTPIQTKKKKENRENCPKDKTISFITYANQAKRSSKVIFHYKSCFLTLNLNLTR